MAQTTACANCGELNPAEAHFCIGCGKSLVAQAATGPTTKLQGQVCPTCGAANPLHAQFCSTCGHATAQPTQRPQPQAAPPANAPQPIYPPPQPRIYPRVNVPPVYVPRPTRPGPQWGQGRINPAVVVMAVVFLVFTVIGSRSGWPLFFLFLPLGMGGGLFRGHSPLRNWGPAFWILGLLFLFLTKTFWPGIFILWMLWAIFGR